MGVQFEASQKVGIYELKWGECADNGDAVVCRQFSPPLRVEKGSDIIRAQGVTDVVARQNLKKLLAGCSHKGPDYEVNCVANGPVAVKQVSNESYSSRVKLWLRHAFIKMGSARADPLIAP